MDTKQLNLFMKYGDKEMSGKMLKAGYTEIAFGHGPLLGAQRVVGMLAYFHPDGRILKDETREFLADGATPEQSRIQAEYSSKTEFESFIEELLVEMGTKENLEEIVLQWRE